MAEEEEIGLEDLWRILEWRERERTRGGPWGNPVSLDREAFLSRPAFAHRGVSGTSGCGGSSVPETPNAFTIG